MLLVVRLRNLCFTKLSSQDLQNNETKLYRKQSATTTPLVGSLRDVKVTRGEHSSVCRSTSWYQGGPLEMDL